MKKAPDTTAGGPYPEEAFNEAMISLVRGVLGGGAFAHDAVADTLSWLEAYGETLSTGEIAELLWYMASGADGKRKEAENIVLDWAMEMARGRPIDNRARVLVHEWCRRRVRPENGVGKKAGRPADDNVKKAAVLFAIDELAKTYPNEYGAKKQIYNQLQIKFGLRRSQLSKLLSGYDPWEVREVFSASRTLSDKSDD